jgi:general secretion pathway protein M
MNTAHKGQAVQATLQARWAALAERERRLLLTAAVVVGTALVWWLALAPALATLRNAAVQTPRLEAQLQQMQALQAQAAALKAQPQLPADEARRSLEALVAQGLAGTAQLVIAGERATITLNNTPADVLAAWLVQVRSNARAVPLELRLQRADRANSPATWSGSVVLALPAR